MAADRAEYMRAYRATATGRAKVKRQKQRERARRLALTQLAELHPVEFQVLFTAFLEAIVSGEQS